MKTYGSRPLYFAGILIIITSLCVFTYAFFDFFEKGKDDAVLAVSIFNGALIILLFFYLRKYVYVIYKGHNSLIIGNLFFKKNVNEDEVQINEFAFTKNMYTIKLKNRVYWFTSAPIEDK